MTDRDRPPIEPGAVVCLTDDVYLEQDIRKALDAYEPSKVLLQRLIKWDTDFPVNCWNDMAGLKELDKIIADAKALLGDDSL